MPTIQQHIFPPKPKKIITPLSPRPRADSDVTPLSPKDDIDAAIASRTVEPVEYAPPVEIREKPKLSRNRLLTGKASK